MLVERISAEAREGSLSSLTLLSVRGPCFVFSIQDPVIFNRALLLSTFG
jgi:hypothetical protein